MGGMAKAVESGWAKLQDRGERGREAGAHRLRRGRDRRRQQVPARRGGRRSRRSTSTTTRCARTRSRGCRRCARRATPAAVQARARRAHALRARAARATCSTSSIQAVRLRATVGEVCDALEKVWGRHRADTQKVTGVYAAAYDSAEGWDKLKAEIARLRRGRGPPAARDDRQARPGRPRPRRQGRRHRVRRPRLRRRHRPAVPDRRGVRAPGDRERRARRRRLDAGGRPQDAGAGAHRGAAGAGRRRHHRLRRRRDPAAGLRVPLRRPASRASTAPARRFPASAKDVLEQIRASPRRSRHARRASMPEPADQALLEAVASAPATRSAARGQGDHADRIDPRRNTGSRADALLAALPAAAGRSVSHRHLRRAGCRQVDASSRPSACT